jgi:putative sterol carrier protein
VRFPSTEWAKAFRLALGTNASYREAAAAWEGEILLRVKADRPGEPSPGVLLDLYHGECRTARYEADTRDLAVEFVYEGARGDWKKLMSRQLDPVKALFDGTFRLRGNLAKAMRFTRAAKELVETAASIPADVESS